MSGINFIGSYSGIDQGMIDKLMEAHKLPINQLNRKKTNISETQNAWKDVNTRLNSLFEKIKDLQKSDTYSSKAAKSSNDEFVTMAPSKNAFEGLYKVNVEQLATNSNIIGGKALEGDFQGEGFFKIANADGKTMNINIEDGDSLQNIAKKINEALTDQVGIEGEEGYIAAEKVGIKASVIDGRLVLNDEKTGARDIGLIGDGQGTLVKLGLNKDTREVNTGSNSIVNINGVKIERDTNSIKDAIDGVTIDLHKSHDEGKTDTVTIGLDTEKTAKAVKAFVDQYNSTMSFIEEKTAAGDPEISRSRGVLAGDSSLMRLQNTLRSMVTSSINKADTDINNISQLGVKTTGKSNKLDFDPDKLKEVLLENPDNVKNFFVSSSDNNGTGFVSRINDYIDGFISKDNGIIKTKNESYEKTLKDLSNQIERFTDRMDKKMDYYTKIFTALDVAMMKAESQMSWLQGQVDAMSNVRR